MVVHETIGMNLYSVFGFILQKECVVELLSPIFFQEPIPVMTLPSDMEGRAIFYDHVTGVGGHGLARSKMGAKLVIKRQKNKTLRN